MWQFFADYPWFTLFIVIAAGSLLGMVRFGPVKLGAAGVLFVGLLLGMFDPDIGPAVPAGLPVLGLALYVYTVGLEAGPAFFRELRPQLAVMIGAVVALVVTALVVGVLGSKVFGIGGPFLAGGYAGIGTTTPGLAAAQASSADPAQPATGYAIGYPLAVVLTILFVAVIAGVRNWPGRRDPGTGLPGELITRTVDVTRAVAWADVPGAADGRLLVSALRSADGVPRVALSPGTFAPGDQVVLAGGPEALAAGVAALGTEASTHLLDRRDVIDYRRILLTNPDLAGRTVAELGLAERYGAKATRVRRGDQDLLAQEDLLLQLDDRVRVVMPRERTAEVTAFLGDTEAKVSEVSAVSMGLGLAAGFLIGIPKLTIGSTVLSLGTAAGPLVMAMVLGRVRRTGPLVWVLPTRANLTLRQIGLLVFLACVGLTSGYAFRHDAFSMFGLKLLIVLLVSAVLSYALMVLIARLLGQSKPRTMGLLAGYVGNPAITAYANSRVSDSRVNTGYATLFALAILVKIVCIQLIVGL
ncbi:MULTISPECIES: aspartate:alanine exchanger family transporter [unclassified Streptomyces]|uniref:aspartate:alanine exchanger family transporter n=1 Tax=unclassified Streptomyces TaxID=2593676 RepID=UPI00166127F2|nr:MULTISPECIES: TrkA C-terminal domain-containing protein [unclassified Streptomyces]MBD0710196.1 transporter [Streptomyces sp. CBMA291]MBD0712921.1 transporter [Streptomyces sp. CBMA370]